jgi:hypothetical protein
MLGGALCLVVVVEALSREFASAGSFGDARVGAVPSGRVRAGEDLGEGVSEVGGESVRGKTRLPGDVAADDAQGRR